MEEMTFTPVVLVCSSLPPRLHPQAKHASQENSSSQFRWRGSLPLIFTGDHFYRFLPSDITPGGTTFLQEEEFTGLLSPVMKVKEGKRDFAAKNLEGFEKLNGDLKRRAERGV